MGISEPARLLPSDEIVGGYVSEQRYLGVQQREIDQLALSGEIASAQCCEDGSGREHASRDVDDGHTNAEWRSLLRACDAHEAAFGLDDEIIAGPVSIGAGATVSAD